MAPADQFCLVPLDDKVAILENSIVLLEDIHHALQSKRGSIDFLIRELADLDGNTHRLMVQIRLTVLSLEKEVCLMRFVGSTHDGLPVSATATNPNNTNYASRPVE